MTDTAEEVVPRLPELDSQVKTQLRNIPIQPRSSSRLNIILEVARRHYEDVGRDKFRLSAVATAAGCAEGTVRRYFKDRVALLDALDPERDTHPQPVHVAPPVATTTLFQSTEPDPGLQDALDIIKTLANRMVLQGKGKGDLKTAGEAIQKILSDRGM